MSVQILGEDGVTLAKVDPTSKAQRVTLYDSNGNEINAPTTLSVNPVAVVSGDIISSLDVTPYQYVSLQLTGTWVGTVTFQGSNDNGTFFNIAAEVPANTISPFVSSSTAVGLFIIPIKFKFLRVRVTAYTSGSVTGVAFGFRETNPSGQITGQVSLAAGAATIGTVALGAGAAAIGTVGVTSLTPSATVGGFATFFNLISAATTNATSVKASAGAIGQLYAFNTSASTKFLKLYNKASAPTVGTDIPVFTIAIAPNAECNFRISDMGGLRLATGIALAITGAAANTDTTAVAAGDVITSMHFV
jgi:hypothetical protein